MSLALAAEPQRPQIRPASCSSSGDQRLIGILKRFSPNRRLPLLDVYGALQEVNQQFGTTIKLISPQVADASLNPLSPADFKHAALLGFSPFPVDAIIYYEKPGCRLGAEIVFVYDSDPRKQCIFASPDKRLVVTVPEEYRGEANIALVVTGLTRNDFNEAKDDIILVPNRGIVTPVTNFPAVSDWYLPDQETTVPKGERVAWSPKARYLWRLEDSNYAGLVIRGAMGGNPRYFDAGCLEPDRYQLVVEIAAKEMAQLANIVIEK